MDQNQRFKKMNNMNEEEIALLQKLEEDKKTIVREKVKLEKQELSTRIEGLVFLKNEISKQNTRHAIVEKIEGLIDDMISSPDTRLDLPTLLRIHESFTKSENDAALGIFSVLKQQIMVQQNNIIAQGSKDLPKLVVNAPGQSPSDANQQKKKQNLVTAKNFVELVDELHQSEFSEEERQGDEGPSITLETPAESRD